MNRQLLRRRIAVGASLPILRATLVILLAAAGPPNVAGNESHAYHNNHMALFAGFTGEVRRERSFTLGLDYERRISESFGLGVLAERAIGDRDFWIVAVPFSLHRDHWKFSVAPGLEHEKGHGEHGLVRLSASYGFVLDGYELAPLLAVDFVEGDTVLVLGMTFGLGF